MKLYDLEDNLFLDLCMQCLPQEISFSRCVDFIKSVVLPKVIFSIQHLKQFDCLLDQEIENTCFKNIVFSCDFDSQTSLKTNNFWTPFTDNF